MSRSNNQNCTAQGTTNDAMNIEGDVENEAVNEVEKGTNEMAGKSVDHPSVPYSLSHPIGGAVKRDQVHSTVVSFQIPANL
jgi:hypothetical protein